MLIVRRSDGVLKMSQVRRQIDSANGRSPFHHSRHRTRPRRCPAGRTKPVKEAGPEIGGLFASHNLALLFAFK